MQKRPVAVWILPRAFLVFIFRQHEIWPTLVSTKEQQQQFARDGSASSNTSCLVLVFFTAYLFTSAEMKERHLIHASFFSDFSKVFSKIHLTVGWKLGLWSGLAVSPDTLGSGERHDTKQMPQICKHSGEIQRMSQSLKWQKGKTEVNWLKARNGQRN